MSRLTIAAYCAAGCGGCDIALLEIHEMLLDLAAAADILFWPTATDFKYSDVERLPDGAIDVCLFNGAIRTDENEHVARVLRAKSKTLVAFGTCSTYGGIPGLCNLYSPGDALERAFTTESTTDGNGTRPQLAWLSPTGDIVELPALSESVRTLPQVVPVDYIVPGCAPVDARVREIVSSLLAGTLPPAPAVLGAGSKSVCDECLREKRGTRVDSFRRQHEFLPEDGVCLLEQGVVCMGPATRSGCGAQCTAVAMPCRGCYGPAGGARDQGSKMIAAIGCLVESDGEQAITAAVDEIVDPAGTFYRFTMPTSVLGRSRVRPATERTAR